MVYLGCHLSSAGGYAAMCKTAAEIGADTFQFFTRNPRGGKAKAFDPADAAGASRAPPPGAPGGPGTTPPARFGFACMSAAFPKMPFSSGKK